MMLWSGVWTEMDLAFASPPTVLHPHHPPPPATRCCSGTVISSACPPPMTKLSTHRRKRLIPLATAAATYPSLDNEMELEKRKHGLLREIQDTQRGLVTTSDERSLIEEALVGVESGDAGKPIDLGKLEGTWRLQYTSAADVLVLLDSSARFPFFQVGQIFQKFECGDQSDGGVVRNVVRWIIPNLLEEQEGATLLVSAKFSVVSQRNIYLQFEEITVDNFKISEELQAIIAPAILPRSFLSLQILQFIRTFKAQVPVRSSGGRQGVGGLYNLSYIDRDMLIGRAATGGVFLFTKAQPLVV